MDILSRLTMIIPTKDRNFFLHEIIRYHAPVVGKIVIVDDSAAPFEDAELLKRFNNVHYFHMAGIDFMQRISFSIQYIDTDFAVIRADRRQIANHGLRCCCSFLDANPDYATADGYTFIERKEGFDLVYSNCTVSEHCSESDAERRVCVGMALFEPSWYAVHRGDVLKNCFSEISQLSIDDFCFYEFYHVIYTLYFGKHKRVPCLYMYMPPVNYDPWRKEVSDKFFERLEDENYLNNFYEIAYASMEKSIGVPRNLIKEAVGCYRVNVFAKKFGYSWLEAGGADRAAIVKYTETLLQDRSYTSRDIEYFMLIMKVRLMVARIDLKQVLGRLSHKDAIGMKELQGIIKTTKMMRPDMFVY